MTFFIKPGLLLIAALFLVGSGSFAQSNTGNLATSTAFLSNKITFDTLTVKDKESLLAHLKTLQGISGKVYFSGNGFVNTVVIQYYGSSETLQPFFDRFVAGSKITFEKCIFKDKEGRMLNVNKSVFFR